MKFWIRVLLSAVLIILMSGCAPKSSLEPHKVKEDLPRVESIKVLSDMTSIGFEWKMVPSSKIDGYMLYRMDPDRADGKLKRVAIIEDRYVTHYVDKGLRPGSTYVYQMATFTSDGFESLQSKPVKAKTKRVVESVSFVRAIANLPKRIKVIWRPHQDSRVVGYVIERATVREPQKWVKIAYVEDRLSAEYMDFDIEQNEVYIYRVRAKLCNGLLSFPSAAVKAITKPLPKPPSNLEASTSLPKRIELKWSESPTADVIYYKVYRSPFAKAFYSYRAKTGQPFYIDKVEEDGRVYYYKVSAIDKDGLESPIPNEPTRGKTLNKPASPTITAAKTAFNHGIILWEPGDDRADRYDVLRSHWEGIKRVERVFTNIYGTKFIDKHMQLGVRYKYRVVEIDRYGLRSEPSEPVELILKKR